MLCWDQTYIHILCIVQHRIFHSKLPVAVDISHLVHHIFTQHIKLNITLHSQLQIHVLEKYFIVKRRNYFCPYLVPIQEFLIRQFIRVVAQWTRLRPWPRVRINWSVSVITVAAHCRVLLFIKSEILSRDVNRDAWLELHHSRAATMQCRLQAKLQNYLNLN